MSESDERCTENEPNINTISELPGKKFSVTMEIPLFITMLGISLTGAAVSNIILYRTCVHSLNHTRDECKVFLSVNRNNETQHLEKEVQAYATFVSTVRSVIEALAPAVLSLFLGVWSDTHGRKPLVVWPLLGIAMTSMMVVVYSMLDNLGPWWYILTLIPYSITGGMVILFTGAFCYISDVTSTEKRSIRMTILEAAVSAGVVVGSLLSSYVIKAVGNIYLLFIAAVLNVLAYVFTIIWVEESLRGAVQGGLSSVLDFLLVKEMIRECFKWRPNFGRAQILMLTIANSLSIFILYGLFGLEYLYVRKKLNWALTDYTLYSSVSTTISFFGGFLGVIIVQRIFRLSDLMFVNIAFLSALAEYIIKALAVTTWHMYLGAGVTVFKGLSSPLLRSLLTKILPIEDIAKVFALMSAIEGVFPLVSPLIYNSLYKYTISMLPGAIYILSSGVAVVCIILVGTVQYFRWNCTQYQRLENEGTT